LYFKNCSAALKLTAKVMMNTHIILGIVASLWTVYIVNGDHIKSIVSRHELGLKDLPREQRPVADTPCSVKYIKHGCYNDKSKSSLRALRELLFQDRYKGKTYSGRKIDWKNWATYLPELVCRCAIATNNKGYVYFGIQFYGECWSSADAGDRFHIYGPNDKCVNTEYKSCDDQASGEACAGAGHANYVYEIVPDFPTGSGVGPPIHPEEY